MKPDRSNQYRRLLENDPPEFIDCVDTPWDQIPDLESYSRKAFRQISRDLSRIVWACENIKDRGGNPPSSKGVLVLGEAGN